MRTVAIVALLFIAVVAGAASPGAGEEEAPGPDGGESRQLTPDEVKRFLDPTRMISRITYDFQVNLLPGSYEIYTNRLYPWYALNNSNALWAKIPFHRHSVPNQSGPSGIGDIVLGWGFLIHENLGSRLTTTAAGVELLFPTGDVTKGTGFDTYVVAPMAAVGLNPTDVFPIYITGKYLHSFHSAVPEASPVRSIEVSIRTFHILPRGFFLAFLPTFAFNLNQDYNLFSLGLGAGRAVSKRFSVQGGYIQYVAGKRTFNQGFTIGLTYLLGDDKSK